jgi:VWFA-related protein
MRVGTKIVDAQQAARHVFSALRSGDRAALFSFDTGLDRVHGFTDEFKLLESAIGTVQPPYGQTSLYDAIAATAREVAAEAGGGTEGRLPQRAAVVVITDGIDTKSQLTASQVSGIASNIDVPVYIVAVMAPIDDPRNGGQRAIELSSQLRDLAHWTGGDLFTASVPAQASLAARQIVGELRHQYLLAFESSSRPGWRPLEVRARDRDLRVRARSGYTAGGGRTSAQSGRD